MSELTRQPVVIDNRGGQAGVLGTDAGREKLRPDGYTIGMVERERAARHQPLDGKKSLTMCKGILPRSRWS